MAPTLPIKELQQRYPDEWVLLGNPEMDAAHLEALAGIPIYHSKDKREVCYRGRDYTAGYEKITLIFTGMPRPVRKIIGKGRDVWGPDAQEYINQQRADDRFQDIPLHRTEANPNGVL